MRKQHTAHSTHTLTQTHTHKLSFSLTHTHTLSHTHTIAAGDAGVTGDGLDSSYCGYNPVFPASSMYVTAVGATSGRIIIIEYTLI